MRTTFPQLLLNHAAQRPTAAAMREKEYGIWQTTTWADMLALVQNLACGLHQAGLKRHEHMIVVGSNRPRLYATMLAAQSLGAIPVPLYQDAVASECVFPINNAEVRFAVVEDQEQVDKMLEIREQCPQLQHVFYDDPRGLRNYDEPGLAAVDELVAAGKVFAQVHPQFFETEVKQAQPDDVAAMFFTSGTTGNPKGVVHTHNTLLNRADVGARFDKLGPSDEVYAGAINGTGILEVEVTSTADNNSLARIVHIVEAESSRRGATQRLADRIAKPLVPGILIAAALTVLVGVLLGDPLFSATSMQYPAEQAGELVENWRARSAKAGRRAARISRGR